MHEACRWREAPGGDGCVVMVSPTPSRHLSCSLSCSLRGHLLTSSKVGAPHDLCKKEGELISRGGSRAGGS